MLKIFQYESAILSGPDWQDLCGHHPGEAPQAQVESYGEDHQEGEGQPGDLSQYQAPLRLGLVTTDVSLGLGPVLLVLLQVLSEGEEVGAQGNL